MTNEQSWVNCRYATASGNGDMQATLEQHDLNEGYNCMRKEVRELGCYPIENIREFDGSFIDVARLEGIMIADDKPSEELVESLKRRVEKSLGVCRHCKFFEPAFIKK